MIKNATELFFWFPLFPIFLASTHNALSDLFRFPLTAKVSGSLLQSIRTLQTSHKCSQPPQAELPENEYLAAKESRRTNFGHFFFWTKVIDVELTFPAWNHCSGCRSSCLYRVSYYHCWGVRCARRPGGHWGRNVVEVPPVTNRWHAVGEIWKLNETPTKISMVIRKYNQSSENIVKAAGRMKKWNPWKKEGGEKKTNRDQEGVQGVDEASAS